MSMDRDRESLDQQLAKAYRRLEGIIISIMGAHRVLDLVAEETVVGPEAWWADKIKAAMPDLAKHRVHVLTLDQDEALIYMLRHVKELARQLRHDYYAGLGEAIEEGA